MQGIFQQTSRKRNPSIDIFCWRRRCDKGDNSSEFHHFVRQHAYSLKWYWLQRWGNIISWITKQIAFWLFCLSELALARDLLYGIKVKKEAKIRKGYNQVPHLTQDTIWDSNKNTVNITNKSQEVSPFPAGDHKGSNEQTRKHEKPKTQKHKGSTKEVPPWNNQ